VIVHSMGGLVARSYIELSKDEKSNVFKQNPTQAKVKKLITLATPHWGGAAGAYLTPDGLPGLTGYTAIEMLNPNHCIYEGCNKFLEIKRQDYYHGLSFLNNINSESTYTRYYSIIGGPIKRVYEFGDQRGEYIDSAIPEFEWSPELGSDYENQAEEYAPEYIKNLYSNDRIIVNLKGNDSWVTVDSGLGYKWKMFTKNFEINMNHKMVFFGPGDKTYHSDIYKNFKVQDQVINWVNE
jgi:hypothetical protein